MTESFEKEDLAPGDLFVLKERGNVYFVLLLSIAFEKHTCYLKIFDLTSNEIYEVPSGAFSDWELQKS